MEASKNLLSSRLRLPPNDLNQDTNSLLEVNIHTPLLLTAAAKSLQSCPTLCDPIPGILQARALEWAAISFSSA